MRIRFKNYRNSRVYRCSPVELAFLWDPWSSFHHLTSVPDAPQIFLVSNLPTTSPWQWLTGKLQSFFLKLEVWRGVNLDRQRRQIQSIWSTISKWFCMEGITVSWAVKEMSPRGNFSRHYHPAYDLPLPWPHLISYNVLPGSFCLNPTGLLAFSQILYTKHTPKPGSFPLPQAHLECFPCR